MEWGAGLSDGMNSSSRSGVNERPTESVKLFSRGMTSCNLPQNRFLGVVFWCLQVINGSVAHQQRRVIRPQSDGVNGFQKDSSGKGLGELGLRSAAPAHAVTFSVRHRQVTAGWQQRNEAPRLSW